MMLDGLRIYLRPSQRRLAHDTRYKKCCSNV